MIEAFVVFLGILGVYAVINIHRRGFSTREMITLALLVALASAGRVAFVYTLHIPSLQPASFVIIATGMVLGGGAGFVVGSLTGVVSNLFLGMGPYTPWQMALWGLMGLSSTLVRGRSRIVQIVFGFAWGFVFGWVMDMPYLLMGIVKFNWITLLSSFGVSFSMDLTHALINASLLSMLSDGWLRKITLATSLELKRS